MVAPAHYVDRPLPPLNLPLRPTPPVDHRSASGSRSLLLSDRARGPHPLPLSACSRPPLSGPPAHLPKSFVRVKAAWRPVSLRRALSLHPQCAGGCTVCPATSGRSLRVRRHLARVRLAPAINGLHSSRPARASAVPARSGVERMRVPIPRLWPSSSTPIPSPSAHSVRPL